MYLNSIFVLFALAAVLVSVEGCGWFDWDCYSKNKKVCIGNSTVSKKGMDEGCGCSKGECQWLKQEKFCPVACLLKEYDVNKASEEDIVPAVYYKVVYPKLKRVDEMEGTITLRMPISALWEDNRIKAKFTGPEKRIKLRPEENWKESSIWNPFKSTRYEGQKEAITITESSELALTDGSEISNNLELGVNHSFNPNGTVVNMRVDTQMTLFCDFDLSSYPLDVQTCHFRMYSENVEQILLNPHTNFHSPAADSDESFDILVSMVEESEGHSATLGFDIQLKRHITPFLFKYYVPCIAVVFLSFISFIVPLTAIPGRLSLLVTLFLTLTNTLMNYMVGIINIT